MKYKSISVFLVFVLIITSLGCINDTIGDIDNTKDILKLIPESCIERSEGAIAIINFKIMRDDGELKDLFEYFKKVFLEDLKRAKLGITFENIDYICGEMGSNLAIFSGDFYLEDCRNGLESRGYYRTEDYLEVEIWRGEDISVGIVSNKLIVWGSSDADVMDTIEVIKGYRISIYEGNGSLRKIANELPNGIVMYFAVSAKELENMYPGARTFGASMVKKDKEILERKYLIEYYSEEDAKIFVEEDFEEPEEAFDVKINRKGKFVEMRAKFYIEDMVYGF